MSYFTAVLLVRTAIYLIDEPNRSKGTNAAPSSVEGGACIRGVWSAPVGARRDVDGAVVRDGRWVGMESVAFRATQNRTGNSAMLVRR
jgi:hypothetical protein